MTEKSKVIDNYFDRYSSTGRAWSIALLLAWIVLHILLLLSSRADLFPHLGVVILVIFGSFCYVPITHFVDQRYRCGGLISLLQSGIPTVTPTSEASSSSQGGEARRAVRIQVATISAGFALTFFILTVQLDIDGTLESTPDYIKEVLIAFFLAAAILNLLQLVLYDIIESSDWKASPFADELFDDYLGKRIRRYRFYSWHFLNSAILIAISLVSISLCVGINGLYGFLLHHYYFIPSKTMKKISDKKTAERERP